MKTIRVVFDAGGAVGVTNTMRITAGDEHRGDNDKADDIVFAIVVLFSDYIADHPELASDRFDPANPHWYHVFNSSIVPHSYYAANGIHIEYEDQLEVYTIDPFGDPLADFELDE